MEKITVFMSTYNGEKYLEKQIESIIHQEDVDVKLVVRDDGSSDKTISILERLSEKYSNLSYVVGENLGYGKSFLELFKYKEYEDTYYAFSDQDDVWLPRKLISAIQKMESKNDKPSIYFSNMTNVDENLNVFGFKDFSNVKISLGSVYVRQRIAGCTMVFNKALLNYARRIDFINYEHHISHEWIYLLCLALDGNVYQDVNSYILYRRHSNASTSVGQGLKKRIKSEMKQMNKTKNDKYYLSKLLLEYYENEINTENLKKIYIIAKYKENFYYRLKLIFGRFLNSGNFLLNLRIKFFVMLGKF